MKKIDKVIIKVFMLVIIFQFALFTGVANAEGTISDIIQAGDNFLALGEQGASSAAGDADTRAVMNSIYSILFPIGVAVTVIIGGVLGIKFMMASVEDKAKIKESMIPYVAGCIAIYGAFGIWRITIEIFSALG